MKNARKSLLAILLVLATAFSATSYNYVTAEEQARPEIEDEGIVKVEKDQEELAAELDELTVEIENLRDENTKHFKLADNTYQAVVFGKPIHRKNIKGQWDDIDNSLKMRDGVISTSDGRIIFASNTEKENALYSVHENGKTISLAFTDAKNICEAQFENSHTELEKSATKLDRLTTLDNLHSKVLYNQCVSGLWRSNYYFRLNK